VRIFAASIRTARAHAGDAGACREEPGAYSVHE
jgi:hypothetical protein